MSRQIPGTRHEHHQRKRAPGAPPSLHHDQAGSPQAGRPDRSPRPRRQRQLERRRGYPAMGLARQPGADRVLLLRPDGPGLAAAGGHMNGIDFILRDRTGWTPSAPPPAAGCGGPSEARSHAPRGSRVHQGREGPPHRERPGRVLRGIAENDQQHSMVNDMLTLAALIAPTLSQWVLSHPLELCKHVFLSLVRSLKQQPQFVG